MKKGLVSVVTPTFNRLERLFQRAEELRLQTYSEIEWIIVNDGSNYPKERLEVFNQLFYNTKIINLNKNSKSVCIPRNIGISNSEGQFIVPADDDVEQFPDKIEKLVSALNNKPSAVLAYGNRYSKKLGQSKIEDEIIQNWNPEQGWGVDNGQILYRSSVYESLPLIFPIKGCDWETAKHITKLGGTTYISDYVCCYLWHDNNRTYNRPKEIVDPIEYKEYFTGKYSVDWRTF